MSTYEEIYGKRVKEFTSDPTLDSSYEGQVWYNSNTETLKSVVSFASWTAAPDMSQARRASGGFGVQTAAVIVGGDNGAGTFFYRNVEEYNGVGFTTGTSIPEMGAPNPGNYLGITDMGQAGTETAGLIFGGESYSRPGNMTAEYDGSSWTITGNMNNLRRGTGCGGTQTAAFACGGYDGSNRTYTENYNGSSWTNSGAMNTAMFCANGRANLAPQTAGLVFGGSISPGDTTRTNTEEYDGSNWTTGGALNNATLNASGGGTQTAGLKFGGGPPENSTITSTENYDGSSWTTGTNMGTLRRQTAGVGSQTAAVAAGGRTTTNLATTEEYNVSINTITAAAWASGGNLNTARNELMGAKEGTQTAALASGGGTTGPNNLSNASEEYNGTSWTEGNNLNTARTRGGSAGTQTAGLIFGGTTGSPVAPGSQNKSEEYDGTSYSEGNNLNTARLGLGGSGGPQTAAIGAGGHDTSDRSTATEEYDGTSWTNGGSLPTATNDAGGAGTSAAMIFGGGNTAGPSNVNTVFAYDGSSWTTSPATLGYSVRLMASSGSSTAAIFSGGEAPSDVATVNQYDGTVFASAPSLSTARGRLSGAGTSAAAIVYGGDPPGNAATEEFTGVTETATAKTLTTS